MRYMGIDYGSKRVGIAISDEAAKFALPLVVLKNSAELIDEIAGIAKENEVKEIVIGESRDYKGKPNEIFDDAAKLKEQLEAKKFVVRYELEFMTSSQAERLQGKHDKVDASAAALILQSYLDHQN